MRDYFDGSPCCTFGPNKSACWKHAGRERFLLARRESQDLEKKELDLAVLSANNQSTSCEVVRASIKYHFEGVQICKTAFLFVHAIGSRRLKNLISHYDDNGLTVHVHGNSRKRPYNRTDSDEIEKIK